MPVLLSPLGAGGLQPEASALGVARRLVEQVAPGGRRRRLAVTMELSLPESPRPAERPHYE